MYKVKNERANLKWVNKQERIRFSNRRQGIGSIMLSNSSNKKKFRKLSDKIYKKNGKISVKAKTISKKKNEKNPLILMNDQ